MKMKKEKHYTYNITNILIAKAYLGVRSCNIDPTDDLGVKYFSSSSDKDFLQEQKEYPERFLYNIIEEFNTREEALEKEIELHTIFDVGNSKDFYNKSLQTSTGFVSDNVGMLVAFNIKEDTWGSWPKEDFHLNRKNYVLASDGMVTAFNIKEDKMGSWPKEDFDKDRDNYIFASDGKIAAFNIKEGRSGLWPKEDFDNNRDNYICAGEGMVNAFNISENRSGSWPKEDFDNNRDNYIRSSDGKVAAFNISENRSGLWPKEEFDNDIDNYITYPKDTTIAYDVKKEKFCRIPLKVFKNNNNYLAPSSNAYKLLMDPNFIPMPNHDDKDYLWCFDRDTLGRVAFLKTASKSRDKDRFPCANGASKKTIDIKNMRKYVPSKDLPKSVVWTKDYFKNTKG